MHNRRTSPRISEGYHGFDSKVNNSFIYNKEKEQTTPKQIPHDDVGPIPEPKPQPKPIAPVREDDGDYRMASFTFFGTEGQVRLPKGDVFLLKDKNCAFEIGWQVSQLFSGLFFIAFCVNHPKMLCSVGFIS